MAWHPRVTDGMTWDGVTFTATDFLATGLGAIIEQAQGLIDQPPPRVSNRPRSGKPGARAGGLLLGARPFTLEGIVWGAGDVDVDARTAALQSTLAIDGAQHVLGFVHRSQGAQQVTCRVEQELTWGDPFERGPVGPHIGMSWQVGMVAVDPRRYAANQGSATTSSISTGGGLAFPWTFPTSFNTGAVGGLANIPASSGNYSRPAAVQVFGPVTNPIIEDTSGRGALYFSANGGMVLTASDYLLVNLEEQTVYLNGDPNQSRYGYIDFTQSAFWTPPKDAWSLRLRGSVISDPARAVVTWRDAFV